VACAHAILWYKHVMKKIMYVPAKRML